MERFLFFATISILNLPEFVSASERKMTPARDPKQFLLSKPKESWKRDKGGGVIEQQSLRRYHGRGIVEEESWKRNQ